MGQNQLGRKVMLARQREQLSPRPGVKGQQRGLVEPGSVGEEGAEADRSQATRWLHFNRRPVGFILKPGRQ